jgi:DNA invertase Pin-like site-specific DNA recombinase
MPSTILKRVPAAAMRVAIYARVSTTKQDNENQLLQLREFARRQGWTIFAEYVDIVTGSGNRDRIQFDRMMQAASQRRCDVLLFWALDRLSREGIVKTIGYLEQLKGWGVGWRSYTQPFLDTGNDMVNGIVLSVLAAVAKQERITISERTKAGMARARRQGKHCGRPYVQVDVARIHQLRRQKPQPSLRAIARWLRVSHTLVARVLNGEQRSTRYEAR